MTHFVPRAALAALTVTAALALSACGSNPIADAVNGAVDNAVEGAVEAGVEKAVEANTGTDVDINVGGNASLPADFPSDVPTPNGGSIFSSIKVDEGWNVNYGWEGVDAGNAAVSDLVATLQAEGWTETSVSDMGEFKSWLYENDTYSVVITHLIDTSNDTVSMTYTVATKATV